MSEYITEIQIYMKEILVLVFSGISELADLNVI